MKIGQQLALWIQGLFAKKKETGRYVLPQNLIRIYSSPNLYQMIKIPLVYDSELLPQSQPRTPFRPGSLWSYRICSYPSKWMSSKSPVPLAVTDGYSIGEVTSLNAYSYIMTRSNTLKMIMEHDMIRQLSPFSIYWRIFGRRDGCQIGAGMKNLLITSCLINLLNKLYFKW